MKTKNFAGLTLVELLIVVAVIAIAATIALPSLQNLIRNNRVTAQNNEMVALINFARSEAVRRNLTINLDLRSDGSSWTADVQIPDDDSETAAACPEGAIRCASNAGIALGLASDSITLQFDNRGYLTPFGPQAFTMTHVPCSAPGQSRRIDILGTGQVTSTQIACGE